MIEHLLRSRNNRSLNEQQVLILHLLKNPLPDADFQQMRNLEVGEKLNRIIEDWEVKKR